MFEYDALVLDNVIVALLAKSSVPVISKYCIFWFVFPLSVTWIVPSEAAFHDSL